MPAEVTTVSTMTESEQVALASEFTDLTGLTIAQLADIERQPEPRRSQLIADWRTLGQLSWIRQPTIGDRAMSILLLFAALSNPVSAVMNGINSFENVILAFKSL